MWEKGLSMTRLDASIVGMNLRLRILLLLSVLVPVQGWAITGYEGINFALPVFYWSKDVKDGGSNSTSTESIYSARLGKTMAGGLYFGGIYEVQTEESSGSETITTNIGASLGYARTGGYIVGHYFFMATQESAASEYEGDGFGFDLGYQFQVTGGFSLGPQLSYRTLKYDKRTVSGTTTSVDREVTTLLPMVALGLTF